MESAFGIIQLSVVPGRLEPSDKSEMITQLLFGEHFSILKHSGNWIYVRNAFDHYESWIDIKQFLPISEESYYELENQDLVCSLDLLGVIEDVEKGSFFPIGLGSSLPYFDGKNCILEGYEYGYEGLTNLKPVINKRDALVENAYAFLNAPYLWGGRTAMGIDCSGFSQIIYKTIGMRLPRDAYQQAEQGDVIGFVNEAEPGDLVFFDNAEGRIIHVGMMLANQKIIHASGKVRIDRIDHQGIFNEETGKYSHQLRVIKRVLA